MPETIDASPDQIRFITDQAAEADFFDGPHRRVADAITIAVLTSDAKTIGLIGPWGSGKSTVVRLVEQALKGNRQPRFHLFSYDAWIHQSDPPRRAFLEQLIAFLEASGFGDVKYWKKLRSKVRRRKQVTDTKTTPVLTTAGRLILLPLFLLPVAFLLSGKQFYDAWTKIDAKGLDHVLFPLGVCLIVLPLLICGGIYLSWRSNWKFYSKAFWSKDNWVKHRSPHEKESILSLISNRHVVQQQTATLKPDEPTAIEFQRLFRRILKPVSDKTERLVIVVDNLDRLDRDEAIAMWTTIRSFFLGAIRDDEALIQADLPTVILPIDASAISKAQNAKVDGDEQPDGQSFMDKSFDVIFHVAPPVLTNWQAFLRAKMVQVFGQSLDESWVLETTRIYRWKADRAGTVTPRDIGRAVNAIAATWLVAKPLGIPFVSVVYYAIYKSAIDAKLSAALASPIIDISGEDPNWQMSLAALHYGIEPDLAAQVFFDGVVRNAVAANNPDYFTANALMDGFGTAVERLFDDQGFLTPVNQANLIELMAGVETQPPWANAVWSNLRRLFVSGNMWDETGQQGASLLQLLLDHAGAKTKPFAGTVVAAMRKWPENLFSDPQFIATAAKMIVHVNNALDGETLPAPLSLTADDRGLLELLAALVERPAALAFAVAERNTKGLAAELAKQLIADSSVRLDEKANVVLMTKPVSWESLCTAASAALQTDLNLEFKSAAVLILGQLFKSSEEADEGARASAQNGQLQDFINQAAADGDTVALARGIILMILTGEELESPTSTNWQELITGHPELPALLDELIQAWREDEFFELLISQVRSDAATQSMIGPLMSAAIKRGDIGKLPVESVIASPENTLRHLDDGDRARFLDLLAAKDEFPAALKAAGPSSEALALSAELIESETRAVRNASRKELVEKLRAVGSDEWLPAVRDGGVLFNTAGQLNALLGRSMALGRPLFDALAGLMPELIASDQRPYAERWFEAAAFLSASHRRTLFRNLRDAILSPVTPPGLVRLLEAGGPTLLNDGAFAAKGDESVRMIVLPLIKDGGLAWLLSVSDVVAAWFRAATTDSRSVIAEALTEVADLDGGDQKRAELLAAHLRS